MLPECPSRGLLCMEGALIGGVQRDREARSLGPEVLTTLWQKTFALLLWSQTHLGSGLVFRSISGTTTLNCDPGVYIITAAWWKLTIVSEPFGDLEASDWTRLWGIWLCCFGPCLSSLWWVEQLSRVSSYCKAPGTGQITSCLFLSTSVFGRIVAIVGSFIMRRTIGAREVNWLTSARYPVRVTHRHSIVFLS